MKRKNGVERKVLNSIIQTDILNHKDREIMLLIQCSKMYIYEIFLLNYNFSQMFIIITEMI